MRAALCSKDRILPGFAKRDCHGGTTVGSLENTGKLYSKDNKKIKRR